jgi:hypothetical protein
MKTYTVAGVARKQEQLSFRVANSIQRDKKLTRSGFTDIQLTLLPQPMSRLDAARYLLSSGLVAVTDEIGLLLAQLVDRPVPQARISEPTPEPTPAPQVKRELSQTPDAIRKRLARAAKRAALTLA